MPGTLAALAETYFSEGRDIARRAFEAIAPDETGIRPYSIVKVGAGQPSLRTDVAFEEGISYESYSPPATWEVPYSVQLVRFRPTPQKAYIYHSGEELLAPLFGQVVYHFFASDENGPPARIVAPPVKPGSMVRVNPQIPHHTWAGGKVPAQAWMIFRHLSDSATSISVELELSARVELHPTPRRRKSEGMANLGKYALIAWGLAEKIRLHRERAHLGIADLAKVCGIDASHISRIENGDTNPSIEHIIRIAKFLRIGLEDVIAPIPWYRSEAAFFQTGANCFEAFLDRPPSPDVAGRPTDTGDHYLHPSHCRLPAGAILSPQGMGEITASWILLKGRVLVDMSTRTGDSTELLEEGSVLHLRAMAPTKIHALHDSQILRVIYSPRCTCKR